MKNRDTQKEPHTLEQFEEYVNLFTLIPGGKGNGIALLRKIVDAFHSKTNEHQYKFPSVLITGPEGSGRRLVAKALANSFALEDIRECPATYLDNGINSSQFFQDSDFSTAHIITDIHQAKRCESVLWRYLKEGKCQYFNAMEGSFSKVIYAYGLIIMTANNKEAVPQTIAKATTHVVELEPYAVEQIKCILHQMLFFLGQEYQGEAVLHELVRIYPVTIKKSIELLRMSIGLMNAGLQDCLTVKLVKKTKRLMGEAITEFDDEAPF